MTDEREVRTETSFWGTERQVIYENNERVGEVSLEERGGFLGMFTETHKVERDNTGQEISYSKQDTRGGFLGIGGEAVEVSYSPGGQETGYSKVEERGGFLGFFTHHERVGYDNDGNETSQTHWERRGDVLGIGGHRARVTRSSGPAASGGTAALSGGSAGGTGSGGGFLLFLIVAAVLAAAAAFADRDTAPTADIGGPVSSTLPVETSFIPASEPPSFDCAKASRWAEYQVCGSAELAAADRDLAALYRERLSDGLAGEQVTLVASQRDWIRQRDRCEYAQPASAAGSCLAALYDRRVAELQPLSTLAPADDQALVEPAPTGAMPATDPNPPTAIQLHVPTIDGPGFIAAQELLAGMPGVTDVFARSVALGGTSILEVQYQGDVGAFRDSLTLMGWTVKASDDRL